MPFTLSHPAAVVPLWIFFRRLPLSALVIGSLSPDFEYLVRLAPRGNHGHTPLGLFTFCLPSSLLVLFVFEALVRGPMANLLSLPPRFAARPSFTLRWTGRACVAIVLGAATHLLWDGFTHGDGWMAAAIPGIRDTAVEGLRWTTLLQRLSTLVGAGLIAAFAARSKDVRRSLRTAAGSPQRLRTCGALLGLAALGAVANAVRACGIPHGRREILRALAYGAVGGMDGLAFAIVCFSVFSHLWGAGPVEK